METKEQVTVLNTGVIALTQAIKQQQDEIERLKMQLAQAQNKQETINVATKKSRKKRVVTQEDNIYDPYKSTGVLKPQAAESIRSYEDFKAIQDYFLAKNKIRDWCLWTVGVSLGIRISDLLSLQYKNVLDAQNHFMPRVLMYEKKTGKLNNLLITECVQIAFKRYFDSIKWKFNRDDFIFSSAKGHGKKPMAPQYAWELISNASKDLNLPIHVGSHTMRKSFANIVACVDQNRIDMNTIVKVQGLLNHNDQTTTMRYLGTLKNMYDQARLVVSDFLLGKIGNQSLNIANNVDNELFDLMEQMEEEDANE